MVIAQIIMLELWRKEKKQQQQNTLFVARITRAGWHSIPLALNFTPRARLCYASTQWLSSKANTVTWKSSIHYRKIELEMVRKKEKVYMCFAQVIRMWICVCVCVCVCVSFPGQFNVISSNTCGGGNTTFILSVHYLINFCPEPLLEPLLCLPLSLGTLDEVQVSEHAHDLGETVHLKNVQELKGLHFKTIAGIH